MIFTFKPDWQPIETAPRNGTVVNLFCRSRIWNTGQPRSHVYCRYKWGIMPAFPDSGNYWVPENNEYPNDNAHLPEDEPFKETTYGEFCTEKTLKEWKKNAEDVWRYNGFQTTHWCLPWDISVEIEHPRDNVVDISYHP